jgi:hypothetical protein
MFGKNKEPETDNNAKVTKEEVINYINKMDIRRAGFGGGLDKVDVYFHIQQIVTLYDMYLKTELSEMEEKYEAEIARLKGGASPIQTQSNLELSFTEDEIQILKELLARNAHLKNMI